MRKRNVEKTKRGRPKKSAAAKLGTKKPVDRKPEKTKAPAAGSKIARPKKSEAKRGRPRHDQPDDQTVVLLDAKRARAEAGGSPRISAGPFHGRNQSKPNAKSEPGTDAIDVEGIEKTRRLVENVLKLARSNRSGRLNTTTLALVYQLKSQGNFDVAISNALGVPDSTWSGWIQRGKSHADAGKDSIYRQLVEVLAIAEAEAESNLVNVIRLSGFKSWQAAAWLLERRFRDRWAATKEGQNFLEVLKNASETNENLAEREALLEKMNALIDGLGLDPKSSKLLKDRAQKIEEQTPGNASAQK